MVPKLEYFCPSETCFFAIVFQLSKLHPSHGSSQTPGSIHDSPYPLLPATEFSQVLSLMSSYSHTAGTKVPKFL